MPRWRKALFGRQRFPDNHVDQTFLSDLRTNVCLRHYRYWPVVCESSVVVQQLSAVCGFGVLWRLMLGGALGAETLFAHSLAMALVVYLLHQLLGPRDRGPQGATTRWMDLKSTGIFVAFTYGFSPVLKTLTESISTDTIYAMSVFMLLGYIVCFDYGADTVMVSSCLSVNMGLFSAVCLASRLPSVFHAFTTVCVALQLFALWPVFLKKLKACYPGLHLVVTVTVFVLVTVSLLWVSLGFALSFSILVFTIVFVCPHLLLTLQRRKDNIHGPWDEAEIKDDLSQFLG
uniref:Phosphatidylinositol N-acetylglucosaminyltransferase subunit C n=1 Tax=Callorhinchus milii TaxID=7868 RepID=V9L576_CALMI